MRNCDEFSVKQSDVEKILDWVNTSQKDVEIPFKPARVLLQDFTYVNIIIVKYLVSGVPAVVDLAAMRDAIKRLGGDPAKINPLCPVDLVIDHSVQVDFARTAESRQRNEDIGFKSLRQLQDCATRLRNRASSELGIPCQSGIQLGQLALP